MANLLDIQAQIAKLQAEAATIMQQERAGVIAEIKEKMETYGLSVSDILDSRTAKEKTSKVKSVTNPAAVKFRGKNGETWSGRGLQPRWLRAELDAGKNLTDFSVA
jgi:DNA-binding protein H-NS